jgi:hypothetical protein
MRVLFLDVDGVLNSNRTVLTTGNCAHPHNYTERREMFDWTAIKLLRGLCAAGNLKVVLSSSWRLGMDGEWLAKFGEFLGLPIIDKTPTDWRPHQTRGHEIKAWLDNHVEVTHYAIVDDDCDMLPEQKPQYVQTWFEDGLTWAPFAKLCDIFEVNPWDCGKREHEAGPDSCEGEGRKGGAPGATDAERAAWLADKIVAQGDYAKEAAEMLRSWPAGVDASHGGQPCGEK